MPGITGVPSIILAVRSSCDTVLVDSLNLRSSENLHAIMEYIRKKRPGLAQLYERIYMRGDRKYWDALSRQLRELALDESMSYAREGHGDEIAGGKPNIVLFTR